MPLFLHSSRTRLACVLAPFALITGQVWASSSTVVISQVYTAGGNSGATYNADYVEIFNLSNAPVSLNGYALQYFSATASATSTPVVSTLPSGVTLQPGQRYLVEATPSTTGGIATANAADYIASNLAMGASAGRIYLTSSATSSPMQTAARPAMWISWATAPRPTAFRAPAHRPRASRSPSRAPTPAWTPTTTAASSL